MAYPLRFHSVHRVALVVLLSVTLVATIISTPAAAQAGPDCAEPFPLGDVTVGMTGAGSTVERGTTPQPFSAEVLGVLKDGIAPGVDMIIADLDSPTIDRVGVWAGMSGSPVYADDGRLLGAVSYGLSEGSSSIGGLTPAQDMLDLYGDPGAAAGLKAAEEVALPAAVQRRAVTAADTTAAEARSGMAQLPLPLAISGLRPRRIDQLEQRITRDRNVIPFAAGGAGATAAASDTIFPGSNFGAAQSYGDLTAAGVGTTTDVCDGRVLAFGHPMLWAGSTRFSIHSADAIAVESGVFGAYKLANIGGVAGTVDQDRLAALRGRLGDGPQAIVARADVRDPSRGYERTGRTWINRSRDVADLAPLHVLANLDRGLDTIGDGRVGMTWTVRGTRGNGTPWKLTRTTRYADQSDVSFEATLDLFDWLFVLHDNRFAKLQFQGFTMQADVNENFQRLRLGTVRVAVNGGKFRRIGAIERLRVRAGDTIKVRAPLIRYQEQDPFRTVNLRLTVPQRLAGQSLRLGVFGGDSIQHERDIFGATSFDDLLTRMRRTEGSNDVIARLQRPGDAGPRVPSKAEHTVGNVVGGRRTVPVTIR